MSKVETSEDQQATFTLAHLTREVRSGGDVLDCGCVQVPGGADCLLPQTRPCPAAQCGPHRGDITCYLWLSGDGGGLGL